jgi:hypothetical protein
VHNFIGVVYTLLIGSNFPSATPGLDYGSTPMPNLVTFTAGNLVQCVTLNIIADDITEADEHFQIIAAPIGGQISIPDSQADFIIIDDDGKSVKTFPF